MKLLNFICAVGCFSCALGIWVGGFYWQAGIFWCMGVLYIKCGLDTRD